MLKGKNVNSIVSYMVVSILYVVQLSNSIWSEISTHSLAYSNDLWLISNIICCKMLTTSHKEKMGYINIAWFMDTATPENVM